MQQPNKPKGNNQVTTIMQQHIGPIPDPNTLNHYNQIQPGFAERIVVMAEKEQSHRHTNDSIILANQELQHKRDSFTFRRGQTLAMLAVSFIVGLCVYCLYLGYPNQAATIATAVIVGLAGVFVYKSNKNSNNKTQ